MELRSIQLGPDEQIDVLTEKIKTLLNIASGGKSVPEELVAMTVLNAVPTEVSRQVRLQHGEQMILSDVISSTKALLVDRNEYIQGFGAAAQLPIKRQKNITRTKVTCFSCGLLGHIQKNCAIVCYRCGGKGYTQRTCRSTLFPGNEQAGLASLDLAAPAKEEH